MGLGAALGLALNWAGARGMIDVDAVGKAATVVAVTSLLVGISAAGIRHAGMMMMVVRVHVPG